MRPPPLRAVFTIYIHIERSAVCKRHSLQNPKTMTLTFPPRRRPALLALGATAILAFLLWRSMTTPDSENSFYCALLLAYSIFALTDEAYSLIAPMGRDTDPRLITRIEALCQLYWISGTALGLLLGQIIPPALTGFEFALTALFLILAQSHSYYRERRPAQAYGLITILIALATVSERNVLATAIAILLALLCLSPRKTAA